MTNLEIKLEKNAEAKLDATEQGALNKLDPKAFEAQVNQIKNTKFDLSDTTKGVTLDTIVKNYNTITKKIEINGEKIPVKLGSDLAAWIQILMIADKKSVAYDSSLGIDANIGKQTKNAIEHYKLDNAPKTNTAPNQPEGNLDIDKFDDNLWQNVQKGIKNIDWKKYLNNSSQYNNLKRGKNKGLLDVNGPINTAAMNVNNQLVITITKPISKTYKISLVKFLLNETGAINENKFVSQINQMFGMIYKEEATNNQKYTTEKEKKGLEDLTKEWNNLQREATNKINKAKTWEEKIKLTDQYSGKYATLSKKITTTKVSYVKAEQTKLAAHINQQKTNLDTTNILTNCPQHINERYAAFKKNVGTGDIMVISALNNYITEAETIVKLQQAYEKRGMVKVPQLTQTILAIRERLVNQKLYITSKAALENNYNAFYKKLTSKDPLQRGQAKAERKQKVERLNKGTYRDSNQPTYKEIFTRVGKVQEYNEYVKKYNILMNS